MVAGVGVERKVAWDPAGTDGSHIHMVESRQGAEVVLPLVGADGIHEELNSSYWVSPPWVSFQIQRHLLSFLPPRRSSVCDIQIPHYHGRLRAERGEVLP